MLKTKVPKKALLEGQNFGPYKNGKSLTLIDENFILKVLWLVFEHTSFSDIFK